MRVLKISFDFLLSFEDITILICLQNG